jgi:hypothetical protein
MMFIDPLLEGSEETSGIAQMPPGLPWVQHVDTREHESSEHTLTELVVPRGQRSAQSIHDGGAMDLHQLPRDGSSGVVNAEHTPPSPLSQHSPVGSVGAESAPQLRSSSSSSSSVHSLNSQPSPTLTGRGRSSGSFGGSWGGA